MQHISTLSTHFRLNYVGRVSALSPYHYVWKKRGLLGAKNREWRLKTFKPRKHVRGPKWQRHAHLVPLHVIR